MPNKKNKIILQSPKGMHDILSEQYQMYKLAYDKAEEIAGFYGFSPIQTPHIERTDIFTATLGETSDVVEKQIYTLKIKGGAGLALRPEGTAGVMRSYIEHGMHNLPQPVMVWYKGSFFRHEKPQKGRLRELQQFGMEIINEEKTIAEAMVIKVLTLILEEFGVGPVVVHINSLGDKECRPAYRKDLLAYYRKHLDGLCPDCKRRYKTNPLRLLDCKEEKCVALKNEAPQMINYLCNACKQHFKSVLEFLDSSNISYALDTHLVRGLDYYSRTVFEIFEDKKIEDEPEDEGGSNPKPGSAKLALAGGGRYDYLAKTLSGKDFPAMGGGIGIDRIVQLATEKQIKPKKDKLPRIFFIQLGAAAKHKGIEVIEKFRKARLPVSQSISKDSLKGQLRIASKLNIDYTIILGQKEILEDSIIVRDMTSRAQETVPMDKVVEIIKKKLK